MKIVAQQDWIGDGWTAIDDDTYDGAPDSGRRASLTGHGETQAEAIEDLLAQIREANDDAG